MAASDHVLPPNRPGAGIQTTHYTVQDHEVSARPHQDSAGSNPAGFQFCEACRDVFQQRSRHVAAGGAGNAGGRGGCRVPSIARRQVQYRSGRAGPTRRKTSGPAATIPETERILRRDRRRNSRFARAVAALVRRVQLRLRGPDCPKQDDHPAPGTPSLAVLLGRRAASWMPRQWLTSCRSS